MSEKHFTVEQANAALPLVRSIVADLVELESRLETAARRYRALKQDADKPQIELNETRHQIAALVEERDLYVAELDQVGVRLGDPARGICDFPAVIDGEPVFLCWELGEEAVDHVHGRHEGYAGRRALSVPCPV